MKPLAFHRKSRKTCLGAAALLAALLGAGALGVAPASAVEVGQPAPDFRLQSTAGKPVSLSDYRGKKNVVLQFYVLDFTPG
ncbi:MAG: redoxin domain-containing protein [Candidatus Tectomicrobia bacterium]|nr:redoxin domain-containing protein [Candidatus Tectomicrobia bacterium]